MTLPSDLLFWILVPVLFFVLFFAWLVYLGRGKRTTNLRLSGLGVSVTISSKIKEDSEND